MGQTGLSKRPSVSTRQQQRARPIRCVRLHQASNTYWDLVDLGRLAQQLDVPQLGVVKLHAGHRRHQASVTSMKRCPACNCSTLVERTRWWYLSFASPVFPCPTCRLWPSPLQAAQPSRSRPPLHWRAKTLLPRCAQPTRQRHAWERRPPARACGRWPTTHAWQVLSPST